MLNIKLFNFTIIIFAILLSSCSNIRESAGVTRKSIDEFQAIENPPLIIPPDFNLIAPNQLQKRNIDDIEKELAQEILFGLNEEESNTKKELSIMSIILSEADAKNAEEEKIENMMNTCGDGTVYENGECVLSPMEKNASDFRTGPLIYSIVIGMSLGIVIMMILWGIGKKSHKVLSDDDS